MGLGSQEMEDWYQSKSCLQHNRLLLINLYHLHPMPARQKRNTTWAFKDVKDSQLPGDWNQFWGKRKRNACEQIGQLKSNRTHNICSTLFAKYRWFWNNWQWDTSVWNLSSWHRRWRSWQRTGDAHLEPVCKACFRDSYHWQKWELRCYHKEQIHKQHERR